MIKNPRNLLWVIPLALFVTSPLWQPLVADFLAPRGEFAQGGQVANAPESQHFVMDTVVIVLTSNGNEEWQITSERAQTGENDREIRMDLVNAIYIGKEKPPTHITSRQGKYFIDQRHLQLIDDVVISRPKTREKLYTDLLDYYDETKMAVSPGDVKLVAPNFQLEGGRMDYDLSTDGYDFNDRVSVDL